MQEKYIRSQKPTGLLLPQLKKIRSWALLHFANLALEIITSQQEKLRGQQRHPLLAPGAGGVPGVRYAAAQMQVRLDLVGELLSQQKIHMGVSENRVFSPQIIPFFIGIFHYFNHPFWGKTPIFGNTHMDRVPIWHKFVWREQMEQNYI